jgi:hypothetical protein
MDRYSDACFWGMYAAFSDTWEDAKSISNETSKLAFMKVTKSRKAVHYGQLIGI